MDYLVQHKKMTALWGGQRKAERIPYILEKIEEVWEKIPDIRLDSLEELRTVPKIRAKGKLYSMDSSYVRTNALNRYRPLGNTDACFCQMCRSAVSSIYLNTNSIFVEPKYYWPQSRISLCFNCSKKFTQLRSNSSFRKQFH